MNKDESKDKRLLIKRDLKSNGKERLIGRRSRIRKYDSMSFSNSFESLRLESGTIEKQTMRRSFYYLSRIANL